MFIAISIDFCPFFSIINLHLCLDIKFGRISHQTFVLLKNASSSKERLEQVALIRVTNKTLLNTTLKIGYIETYNVKLTSKRCFMTFSMSFSLF